MIAKNKISYFQIFFSNRNYWQVIAFLFFLFLSTLSAYQVQFEGVNDADLLKLVQSSSQLEKLKDNAPSTRKGLKRRADSDISNILQVLQSRAYYDAKVNFTINQDQSVVKVVMQLGPVYPLRTFKIRYLQNGKEISESDLKHPIKLKDLHIKLNEPALPETILNAEETLLDKLNLQGYAFSNLTHRDVFADQSTHTIIVLLVVDIGPLTFFGPLKIKGNHRVKEAFFFKKLRWTEGEVYNPILIEKTQEVLELAGVFKSVTISKAEKPAEDGSLPLEISVLEGKQRSLEFGLSYNTDLGPGILANWEDRNIAGEGERLSTRADLWIRAQRANITYVLPDFLQQEQNLVWEANYVHENFKAFTESSFSVSGTINRKFSDKFRLSYGTMYTFLHSERSARDGTFDLLKFPIEFRWTTVDSILDPTEGMTAQFKIIPSFQLLAPQFNYTINTFTGTYYYPLKKNKRSVLAVKLSLGTIIGAKDCDIPGPERFYTGTENSLRGYRYLTVSPLYKDGKKPLGGRSLFVYSLEFRQRFGENYGIVYFYEIGNVYKNPYIDLFKHHILQSAGIGFRYYTPIGPLRIDFAFPLTPRRHLDRPLEVYFSIGQTY